MAPQTKSKKRIAEFGEVYTAKLGVESMLDTVKTESYRIESRFLEPAAGNGNFLEAILERKLEVVRKSYRNEQNEYERYAFIAISSIYGIDILEDNVSECRERLFNQVDAQYTKLFKKECREEFKTAIRYVLSKNIIHGDGLTGLMEGPEAKPIIFSEWGMSLDLVKRRDFAMNDLAAYENLFNTNLEITKPRKKFDLIHFREVYKLG